MLTLHVDARIFDDGMLGIKTRTELAPGAYDAVVVLRRRDEPASVSSVDGSAPIEHLDAFIDRMRKAHVEAALARAGGNRTHAARMLGVDVRTVFRLLDRDEPK